MSLSNEWTEYHLTPRGWVEGSSRVDIGNVTTMPIPADRVLTKTYHETQSSSFSKMHKRTEEDWRSDNEMLIRELLQKFGPCPQCL
jgi:hypothetical protein